jgi:hypothetical protein
VKSPASKIPRRVAVWTISVLVFILTLEASIRIEDRVRWGAPMLGTYSHAALFTVDSIGWHPRPGARYQKWIINEHGFRGPSFSRDKPPGIVRVAVLGSSETFGQAENAGQEFPRILERMLNENTGVTAGLPGERFEVVNAGVPGMSVARMGAYWNRWVRNFDVDVVVVYGSPTFYLGAAPPPDSEAFATLPPTQPANGARLLPKTREAINRFLPESFEAILKRVSIRRIVAANGDGWVWKEVPQDRLNAYLRHTRELVETLSQSGQGVVLATHASAVERPLDSDDRAILVGWRKFLPRAEPEMILEFEAQANAGLIALGRETGVPVVRLDQSIPHERRFFSDHQHFLDAGAEIAAQSLVDAVLDAASTVRETVDVED